MIKVNDTVEYKGKTCTVEEIGEDGSLALSTLYLDGVGWDRNPDFGPVDVGAKEVNDVLALA